MKRALRELSFVGLAVVVTVIVLSLIYAAETFLHAGHQVWTFLVIATIAYLAYRMGRGVERWRAEGKRITLRNFWRIPTPRGF